MEILKFKFQIKFVQLSMEIWFWPFSNLPNTQINFPEPPICRNLDKNIDEILIIFEVRNLKKIILLWIIILSLQFKCTVKAKSKLEMCRLLLTDGKVYLPPMKKTNYNYIRGVLTGKKKFKNKSIININLYFWIIWSHLLFQK